jgi:hypothetical protein
MESDELLNKYLLPKTKTEIFRTFERINSHRYECT